MSPGSASFSRRIKDELVLSPCTSVCCRQVELAAAIWSAGKFTASRIDFTTGHARIAARLADLLKAEYGLTPVLRQGRELVSLRIAPSEWVNRLRQAIADIFLAARRIDIADWSPCCRQALLRSLFLACGSVSEPQAAYHMELAIRQENQAAGTIQNLLGQLGLNASLAGRGHYQVLYLREGQHLADYLILAGAHQSLLTFESLRVEKEMRNSVNRVVNCDNANLQRVANTAARQSELYRALQARSLEQQLPEDVLAAAQVRFENPDLTLRELGALMVPPLGKSGMNHRLMRFEQLGSDLLARKEG